MDNIEQIQNGEPMSSVRQKLNQLITQAISEEQAQGTFVPKDTTADMEITDKESIFSEETKFRLALPENQQGKVSGASLLNAIREEIGDGGGDEGGDDEGGDGETDPMPMPQEDIEADDAFRGTSFYPVYVIDETNNTTIKRLPGDRLSQAIEILIGTNPDEGGEGGEDEQDIPEMTDLPDNPQDFFVLIEDSNNGQKYKIRLNLLTEH